MRRIVSLAVSSLVGLTATASVAQSYSSRSGATHEFVNRGVPKTLTLFVPPTATCTLWGSPDDPDERGVLTFDAQTDGNVGTVESFDFVCTDRGIVTRYPVDIEVTEQPVLSKTTISPQMGRALRPAFRGDPDTAPQDELHRQGYPSRPDPKKAPGDYLIWKQRLNVPMVAVTGRGRELKDVTFDTHSSNWSGAVLGVPVVGHFMDVTGEWTVPHVSSQCFFSNELLWSGAWAGLGGAAAFDSGQLIQAGTMQRVLTGPPSRVCVNSREYRTWYQIYPQMAPVTTPLAVSPGDRIYVEIHSGNAAGFTVYPGDSAWFFMQNMTRGTYLPWTRVPFSQGNVFSGLTAEWIMERPSSPGGTLYDLPNYGEIQFSQGWAYESNWAGTMATQAQAAGQFNMFNCTPGSWPPYNCTTNIHALSSRLWTDPVNNVFDLIWNAAY